MDSIFFLSRRPRVRWPTGARRALPIVLSAILGVTATPASAAASEVLDRGLQLLHLNYLFDAELDAARLLGEALEHVEARIPEVRASAAGEAAYLVESGPCRLRLEVPPASDVRDLAPVLEKVAALVDACVLEKDDELPPAPSLLLAGLLAGLDPYSTVFDADRKTEHTIQFRGKLAGIGARIGIRDERLTLVTVYEESPAHKAGLRDDDVVRRIDGHSTTNLPVSEAVQRIRGKVGTPVQLTIERDGQAELDTITVIRGLVTIPSVSARLLDNDVVYASISHFSQTTPADFRTRVSETIGPKKVKGVIIDLRRNSGGSMLGSSAIGDLFLEDGLLITTAGRGGRVVSGLTAEMRATRDTPFADLPLILLTSPRTASGSELLAASLRNNDRALLAGERTFGKGTVQKTYGLGSDSSMKITVGHFLPNGRSIPGGGLVPNIEIHRIVFSEAEVRVPLPHDTEDLPFWLRSPEWLDADTAESAAVLTYVSDRSEQEDEEEGEKRDADDEVVELVSRLLADFGSTSAATMLRSASASLMEQARKADTTATERLAERGMDWSRPDSLSALAGLVGPSLSVAMSSAGGSLRAGEASKIDIEVTNTGTRPLYRVRGTIESDVRFLNGLGLLFGRIDPGKTRSWSVEVEPPPRIRTSRVEATVIFHDDRHKIATSGPILLAVETGPRPRLAHRISVPPGEPGSVKVHVDIVNRGNGIAKDVKIFLKHPESNAVELVDASVTIEELAAGGEASVELGVRLVESPQEPLTLDLVVAEPTFGTFLESPVTLADATSPTRWHEPPHISVRGVRAVGSSGEYEVLAEVSDDGGLAALWTRVDGTQIDYIDAASRPTRSVRIGLPWQPAGGVQRIEITATDAEGLQTRYVADM